MDYLALRAVIIEECARTFWVEAVYHAMNDLEQNGVDEDEPGYTYDQLVAADGGGMFHTIPNEAREAAVALLERFDKYNRTILAEVLSCMDKYAYTSQHYVSEFAHYLTMGAIGHGVGIADFSYSHFRGLGELTKLFEKLYTPNYEAYDLADIVYTRVVDFAALDAQQEEEDE